ncbi:hypothetical protein D3C78_1758640 [compost metagenome]
MVDEDARFGRLEAQGRLLAGIDLRQAATAQGPRCCVKVDIVQQRVGGGVDQSEFDIVVLVDDHQRAWNRTVEGHGVHLGALAVDHKLLFLEGETR